MNKSLLLLTVILLLSISAVSALTSVMNESNYLVVQETTFDRGSSSESNLYYTDAGTQTATIKLPKSATADGFSVTLNSTREILNLLSEADSVAGGVNTRDAAICRYSNGDMYFHTCYDSTSTYQIWDITNTSATPTLVGDLDGKCYANIHVVCEENYTIAGDLFDGIQILNFTDPTNITDVGGLNYVGDARGNWILGTQIYSAAYSTAIYSLDKSGGWNNITQSHSLADYGNAYDIYCSGIYCYVADDGLTILNVSTPTAMTEVGRYAINVGYDSWWVESNADDTIMVVSQHTGGLFIINTTDKTNPTQLWNTTYPNTGRGMKSYLWEERNLLYVSAYTEGIYVYDISDWSNPVEVYHWKDPVSAVTGKSYALDFNEESKVLGSIHGSTATFDIKIWDGTMYYAENTTVDVGNNADIDYSNTHDVDTPFEETFTTGADDITTFLNDCAEDADGFCLVPLKTTIAKDGGNLTFKSLAVNYTKDHSLAVTNFPWWQNDNGLFYGVNTSIAKARKVYQIGNPSSDIEITGYYITSGATACNITDMTGSVIGNTVNTLGREFCQYAIAKTVDDDGASTLTTVLVTDDLMGEANPLQLTESVQDGYKKTIVLTSYDGDNNTYSRTSYKEFTNITFNFSVNDETFTKNAVFQVYSNSVWSDLTTTECANGYTETETNYTTTDVDGIGVSVCYLDNDVDGIPDYFKVMVEQLDSISVRTQDPDADTIVVVGGGSGGGTEIIILTDNASLPDFSVSPIEETIFATIGGRTPNEMRVINDGIQEISVKIYVDPDNSSVDAIDWVNFGDLGNAIEGLTVTTLDTFDGNVQYILYWVEPDADTTLGEYNITIVVEDESFGFKEYHKINVVVTEGYFSQLVIWLNYPVYDFRQLLCKLNPDECDGTEKPITLYIWHIIILVVSIILLTITIRVIRNRRRKK